MGPDTAAWPRLKIVLALEEQTRSGVTECLLNTHERSNAVVLLWFFSISVALVR